MQSVRNLPARLVKLRRGLKLESGGSLPSALITLAVGSLLLTPFLSFVSTRSLGTRAAGETFNEQYAADAGVEFGIWSVLNIPVFRTQVDSNPGVAQPVSLPGSVNGYTPTVMVTGNSTSSTSWIDREFSTFPIGDGGALVYTGGDQIYALAGNNTSDFASYNISSDQWTSLASTLGNVGNGGALVYTGGNYIYSLQGGNVTGFWRYDISNDTWDVMTNTPGKVKTNGALAYPGGNLIYGFWQLSPKFWVYNISSNSWSNLGNLPAAVGDGAALVAVGGNTLYALRGGNNATFWRYDILTDAWSFPHITPFPVNAGGSLSYYSEDLIYALQGNSTGFWRYTVTMDNWTVLPDSPSTVGGGGSLVATSATVGFAFRGSNQNDFWEFADAPPQYDITSQAGSVEINARIEIDGSNKTILVWDID